MVRILTEDRIRIEVLKQKGVQQRQESEDDDLVRFPLDVIGQASEDYDETVRKETEKIKIELARIFFSLQHHLLFHAVIYTYGIISDHSNSRWSDGWIHTRRVPVIGRYSSSMPVRTRVWDRYLSLSLSPAPLAASTPC